MVDWGASSENVGEKESGGQGRVCEHSVHRGAILELDCLIFIFVVVDKERVPSFFWFHQNATRHVPILCLAIPIEGVLIRDLRCGTVEFFTFLQLCQSSKDVFLPFGGPESNIRRDTCVGTNNSLAYSAFRHCYLLVKRRI